MGKEQYLYDGVYASFDGFMIKLQTERENRDHVIYIEPELWEMLDLFAKQCWPAQQIDDRTNDSPETTVA